MTKFNSVVVTAAALLLAGSTWAMPVQPAAGQAPLFNGASIATGAVQRQSVHADAVRHMPAAGEMSARPNRPTASARTRVETREAMREAIDHGFVIGVGNRS